MRFVDEHNFFCSENLYLISPGSCEAIVAHSFGTRCSNHQLSDFNRCNQCDSTRPHLQRHGSFPILLSVAAETLIIHVKVSSTTCEIYAVFSSGNQSDDGAKSPVHLLCHARSASPHLRFNSASTDSRGGDWELQSSGHAGDALDVNEYLTEEPNSDS